LLPKEVDIESIKASINHGVLTLKLPKIDKDRKIKVQLN
jgi:HSP20 family molecular chaperone IbpA